MDKIRVIFVVVDTHQLTLYREDGNKMTIPQGDPRVRRIVEEYLPILDRQGVVEMDVSIIESSPYDAFEEETKGVVRFFKVAAKKVAAFFGAGDEASTAEPGEHGQKPSMKDFVNEVMAHAKPNLSADTVITPKGPEQLVAVVGDVAIPGVEQLSAHVKHAVKLGSTKGMEAFFKRIAPAMEKRQHSIEDLLRFMEKGDLPVADDGSIIAYKILSSRGDTFVDCHTGRVKQNVGSFVCVDESLVDRNRRNECSNGLHIARRAYLRGFPGDSCFLVKIAPEDVVTVPHNDPNKVRVCAYHLIDKLSNEAFAAVKADKPMTEIPEARAMLARAISGDHVGKLEEVRITQQRGEGVIYTPLSDLAKAKAAKTAPVAGKVVNAIAIDDPEISDKQEAAVSPLEASKTLEAARNQNKEDDKVDPTKPYAVLTRKEQARQITNLLMALETPLANRKVAAENLLALKKQHKVSWEKLGVTEAQLKMMNEMLADAPAKPKVSKKIKQISQLMHADKAQAEANKPTANDNIRQERDREVARLHGLGKNKAEISRALNLSTRTIGRIIDKLTG